jgi:hypothetical protein
MKKASFDHGTKFALFATKLLTEQKGGWSDPSVCPLRIRRGAALLKHLNPRTSGESVVRGQARADSKERNYSRKERSSDCAAWKIRKDLRKPPRVPHRIEVTKHRVGIITGHTGR